MIVTAEVENKHKGKAETPHTKPKEDRQVGCFTGVDSREHSVWVVITTDLYWNVFKVYIVKAIWPTLERLSFIETNRSILETAFCHLNRRDK